MSAKTANNVLQKKDVEILHAFPVDTGEIIYQNTIAGIGVDGLLKNVALANVAGIRLVGIIADDSANTTPAATTADGNITGDRTSPEAGDKTVRLVWLSGRFLLDFVDTLSADEVGKVAYAKNNNDCSLSSADAVPVGTIISVYSSSKAWVELNTFYRATTEDVLIVKKAVTGSASTAVGGWLSIDNPFGAAAILESFTFEIVAASTGAATIDIGVGTTVTDDTLMDGLVLNGAVTGIKTSKVNAGTNGGILPKAMASGDKVIGTGSATAVGLTGFIEAKFRRWL
jgi:hypothetical protein